MADSRTVTAASQAVAPAVSPDWLTVDSSAAQAGYHTAAHGDSYAGSEVSPSAAVVPVPGNPMPETEPEFVTNSEGYQFQSEGQGAWPSVPSQGNANQYPLQRQEGYAQGQIEALPPVVPPKGFWSRSEPLQTFDYVYQATDTEGWRQNVPNDRTSHRNTYGQANPENNPTWYPFGERPVTGHKAIRPVDMTADYGQGTPGASYGSLPDWSATGSQGNTEYVTPGPPATTSPAPVTVADPTKGWA